jgi:hypothetical protein
MRCDLYFIFDYGMKNGLLVLTITKKQNEKNTRMKFDEPMAIPTLFYGCETWIITMEAHLTRFGNEIYTKSELTYRRGPNRI